MNILANFPIIVFNDIHYFFDNLYNIQKIIWYLIFYVFILFENNSTHWISIFFAKTYSL